MRIGLSRFPTIVLIGLWFGSLSPVWAQSERDIERCGALNQRMLELDAADQCRDAVLVGEELVELARKTFGPEDPDYATALNNLGLMHYDMGNYVSAEPLLTEALKIRRGKLDKYDSEFAESLTNLGHLYKAVRKYAEAEDLFQEVMEIAREKLGAEHPAYGMSVIDLADLYETKGEYAKAIFLHEKMIEIVKVGLGEHHLAYVVELKILAELHLRTGEYSKGRSFCERAAAIVKASPTENSPEHAQALTELAQLYVSLGDYETAEKHCRMALEITGRVAGKESAEYAKNLHALAKLCYLAGSYGEAERVAREAGNILRDVYGANHPKYASGLSFLSVVLHCSGDYVAAEQLALEAIRIQRNVLGDHHIDYATSLDHLAQNYRALNEYEKAEQFFMKAIEIVGQTLGEEHPTYAQSLNNLAGLYEAKSDWPKARQFYEQAVELQRLASGEQSRSYVTALINLAGVCAAMDEHEEAERLYQRAIPIGRKVLGEQHPLYGTYLSKFSELYQSMGYYDKCEVLIRQAKAIYERSVGTDHPEYANASSNLAFLLAVSHRPALSLDMFEKGMEARYRHTTTVLTGLSEARQLAFFQQVWPSLGNYLSVVHQHPEIEGAVRGGALWVARWKGLVLETQTHRQRLLQSLRDPQLAQLHQEYIDAREELARLVISPPLTLPLPAIHEKRKATEDRATELESVLARRSREFAELRSIGQVDLTQIAQALPPNATLIDIMLFSKLNYKEFDAAREAGNLLRVWGGRRYVAFVTPAGQTAEPILIDLGLAEPINQAVADFRLALQRIEAGRIPDNDTEIRQKLMALRRLVLDPMLPFISSASHWIVCPTDQLALVPFECFPISGGQYLVESRRISYLGTARLAIVFAGPTDQTKSVGASILVGNPDFNLSPDDQIAALAKAGLGQRTLAMRGVGGSRELQKLVFSPLPTTAPEVQMAARMIGGTAYVGERALEGVVKQVDRPKVLYLATHGFFLPQPKPELPQGPFARPAASSHALSPGVGALDQLPAPGVTIANPLLRCGLALAGANRRDFTVEAKTDDGILTGMEVAMLNLRGTELVVLSACQTGLGDIYQGEGVMGLKRAFLLAGARRVVATLWMVPDKQTQQLMTNFIHHWQSGMPASEALRESQVAMISRLRKDHGHAHPFFWAAFTLTGDWR